MPSGIRSAAAASPDLEIDRLRLVLLRLARAIRTRAVEELTPSQLAILSTVVRRGPLTVGQIAEIEHVKPPSVSKIVGALEAIGHVERSIDPGDRRCVNIVASPAGVDYLESVRAVGRTWLASQVADLDDVDQRLVAAAVPALERLLAAGSGDAS